MQAFFPKSAKWSDPGIDLLKRLRLHRIDASGPIHADTDEPALPQCPEMLRNGRLRDVELLLDQLCDSSGTAFAAGEEFQNPAPDRIPEDIKGVHGSFAAF